MTLDNPLPHVNSGVYVLLLEGSNFYVGMSRDIHQRLKGHSTAWTSKHEPLEIEEIFPAKKDLKQLEKEVTLMYMRDKGWENVRGYAWTEVDMSRPPKAIRNNITARLS